MIKFKIHPYNKKIPDQGRKTVYLIPDNWNDYSFKTLFEIHAFDEDGVLHELEHIKIGFKGQTESTSTEGYLKNNQNFDALPKDCFSLGVTVDYYKKLAQLNENFKQELLSALNDLVYKPELLDEIKDEPVLATSLLRDTSWASVEGQYLRALNNQALLTDYNFEFSREKTKNLGEISLEFKVKVESKPATNIHAIIGRNGVGKTTLLNGMIEAVTCSSPTRGSFYEPGFFNRKPISSTYFSSLISVSFSAFDPFNPPVEQSNPANGTCYYYLGFKNKVGGLKEIENLYEEFVSALSNCLRLKDRKERWLQAIKILESDVNFANMNLSQLADINHDEAKEDGLKRIRLMSSGHAVVLLTITKLVAHAEEKTLVILDEPESHLHPPLLSAFIRALSELLLDRNGVAIIATHSPVVLQEIPKSCVWKINRVNTATSAKRPDIETFGENVGILTREVFGLEVIKSGFHNLLAKEVESGGSYEEIALIYGEQLGLEARVILKTLVTHRDLEKASNDANGELND